MAIAWKRLRATRSPSRSEPPEIRIVLLSYGKATPRGARPFLKPRSYERRRTATGRRLDSHRGRNGARPKDAILTRAERFVFDTLLVNPIDPGALDGLANTKVERRGRYRLRGASSSVPVLSLSR
jgi:hypothetical protein